MSVPHGRVRNLSFSYFCLGDSILGNVGPKHSSEHRTKRKIVAKPPDSSSQKSQEKRSRKCYIKCENEFDLAEFQYENPSDSFQGN